MPAICSSLQPGLLGYTLVSQSCSSWLRTVTFDAEWHGSPALCGTDDERAARRFDHLERIGCRHQDLCHQGVGVERDRGHEVVELGLGQQRLGRGLGRRLLARGADEDRIAVDMTKTI